MEDQGQRPQQYAHLIGRLGKDPELRFTKEGKAFTTFSLAVTKSSKRPDGEWDTATTWYEIKSWDVLAENAAECLKKGYSVVCVGKVIEENYEGKTYLKLHADHIGPNLKYGTAEYTPAIRETRPAQPVLQQPALQPNTQYVAAQSI
ncbi:single-stranded DNA-binding protein [Ferrimicrobium acidiphilum]|uniref:single-stranded DNA-binding protein n=1 Tax=Ferrimicrobium acidiphilum TaxID=121039 RepID=UPI0023F04CF7|nr:single-stranded DNA-binding protein [Ferrimicrobium acidiphilum]